MNQSRMRCYRKEVDSIRVEKRFFKVLDPTMHYPY